MTKRKHPRRDGGANVASYESTCELDVSTPRLIREDHRLHADDIKNGFCLEVGELEQRRMYPFGSARRHAYQMTSRPKPQQGRASVDHDTVGVLYFEHIEVDGMSRYPHPLYPEPEWEMTYGTTL